MKNRIEMAVYLYKFHQFALVPINMGTINRPVRPPAVNRARKKVKAVKFTWMSNKRMVHSANETNLKQLKQGLNHMPMLSNLIPQE